MRRAEATSDGAASRPSGIVKTNAARPSSGSPLPINVRSIGVSAATEARQLTRMPSDASSSASVFARCIAAAFDAA